MLKTCMRLNDIWINLLVPQTFFSHEPTTCAFTYACKCTFKTTCEMLHVCVCVCLTQCLQSGMFLHMQNHRSAIPINATGLGSLLFLTKMVPLKTTGAKMQ